MHFNERDTRFGWQDHEEKVRLATPLDVRGGGEGLDLLGGGTGVGSVDEGRVQEVFRRPFGERFRVVDDRRWGRIVHMREDHVEHRSGMRGQIQHELLELAVEVCEEKQRLLTQHGEAGVMHGADGILPPEHVGHQCGQLRRQLAGICRRRERKGQGEMALTDGATHKGFSLLIM